MPIGNSGACIDDCALDVAAYLKSLASPAEQGNTILSSSGTFDSGPEDFDVLIYEFGGADGSADFSSGTAVIDVFGDIVEPWARQLFHPVSVEAGEQYTLCFDARANETLPMAVLIDAGPDLDFAPVTPNEELVLSSEFNTYIFTWTADLTAVDARLTLNVGLALGRYEFDNITLARGDQCASASSP